VILADYYIPQINPADLHFVAAGRTINLAALCNADPGGFRCPKL
jgi:hypothetical protein